MQTTKNMHLTIYSQLKGPITTNYVELLKLNTHNDYIINKT